jgi:hypothetical protein
MKFRASATARAAMPYVCAVGKLSSFLLTSFVIFSVLFHSQPSRAQTVLGSIVGTVTDTSGAVIPGATVTVTDINKGISQSTTANATGNFTVTNLVPDVYQVKSSSPGFAPAEVDNVTVIANGVQEVNLQMKAGAAQAQTVVVTAAAPPLQTEQVHVGLDLDERQIQSLPNINRNASQTALLTPGVQRSSFSIDPTQNPQGTVAVEALGMNYGTTGWLLDGTDNREPVLGIIVVNPTLDSLSNIQFMTANYPAEFGGAVGGFVTAQTKSGGNHLHGDAFWFRRSGEFAARDPFTQFPGIPFPGQLYNQFGGSVGGPIIKDRSFFFLDYQGTRQRVGLTVQQNVPTALVRSTCLSGAATCDLSQYASTITAPTPAGPGAPIPANAVPASLLTPQGIALLSMFPAPNAGGPNSTSNNYIASGNGLNNADQADVRLDEQATQTIHAFARYDYSNYRLTGIPVFGALGGTGFGIGNTTGNTQGQNQSASAGADWAINNNLLTDFRFGFLDYHIALNELNPNSALANAVGIPNLNTPANPGSNGTPTFNVADGSISNFGLQGCNCPLLQSEQVFQLVNNWTKIIGNHSIRFGGDIRYALNLRNASDSNRAGQLSFNNGATGTGIASVLMGYIDTFLRFDIYDTTAANRQKRGAFYAEDRWRIRPNFTLNYGVRWDIVYPETVNTPGAGGFTDLSTGFIRVAGVGGFGTNGGASVDLTNFGGRLGFAWQFRPRSVLRAGAAQMYDSEGFFGTIFGTVLAHNIPVVANESKTAGNATNLVGAYNYETIPAVQPPFFIPPNGLIPIPSNVSPEIRPNTLTLPRVNQWNLSLQQELTNDMTFTLAYVGTLAERIYPSETYGFNVNVPVLPSTPAQLANRDARRPYFNRFSNIYEGQVVTCCSQDITSTAPAARSNYNALQASVQQRFSHGLQFDAHYTWSRALNYGATYFAQDPSVEYGPSDTNRNQVLQVNGLWDLPVGRGKALNLQNRILDAVAGGWRLSNTTTWESGLPFTPTYAECGADQDIDSNFSSPGTSSDCRPNRGVGTLVTSVGSFNPVTHSRTYFTPVAPMTANGVSSGPFIRPAFGTIGNIGRNSMRGPKEFFSDAAIFKTFGLTEHVRAQFQFQAFNVFNVVPLGVPSATNARCIDCLGFTGNPGEITSVDSAVSGTGLPYMRTLQFGARIEF